MLDLRRWYLGPLLALLTAAAPLPAQTVFRYSLDEDALAILPQVLDVEGPGNDATAWQGALLQLSENIPTDGLPDDVGTYSLDVSAGDGVGIFPAGYVTDGTLQLLNTEIAAAGGFTMETWFLWNGLELERVNSIIDYAGTEKLVIDTRGGAAPILAMRIAGTGDVQAGEVTADEWHYVAAVFDTEGGDVNGDGTINGTVRVYFDSLRPAVVQENALKDNFGDGLVRGIGIGQHPLGFGADFFDGLVFEPRVTLGALAPEDLLLDALVIEDPEPVFHYRFGTETALPAIVDQSGAGHDATAGAAAAIGDLLPPATPEGGGDGSLDTSAGGAAGAVTDDADLLTADAVMRHAGFTLETWFLWNGGGGEASIIDAAGSEKLVVEGGGATPGQVSMVLSDSTRIPVGVAEAGTWHYAAVIFDTGGNEAAGDGSVSGSISVFFDSTTPASVTPDVVLDTTGDSRDLGVGIGQAPDGAAGSVLDGAVYEPRLVLGALSTLDLSWVRPLPPAVTVLRYSFFEDSADLFPVVFDESDAGNDATAGAGAAIWPDAPVDGVPSDAGEAALDAALNDPTIAPTGIVTDNTLLLSNELIEEYGGFTYECWFQWMGAGNVNSVIDYAGTEKIVIRPASDPPGLVEMLIGGTGNIPIATATPETWHYIAVVFHTGGRPRNADGTISGTVRAYFDGIEEPVTVYEGATKSTQGDDLVRSIGIAQHPLGFPLDFLNGLVFEPRVTLGPLSPEDLLYEDEVLPTEPEFVRGDSDASGAINITDGIFVLNFLFLGGPDPSCRDAADADDSGALNITDGIYILNFLFLGGPEPPAPTGACGPDSGEDELDCVEFLPCAPV